ncbi:MAG TPA: ABC transporter permease [Fimbriimonadaceae bacterium]|nr:ABC transporter permease [Fimbriimonadaceae bacterium]
MLAELKELWRFRELLFSMVQRDLKIRYKNSFLGFLWSLLNPLVTVGTMTLVFRNVMENNTANLGTYIFAAFLPYMFFQLAVMDSAQTIISNIQLIKKIYFPREILPLASAISNFIHFLMGLLVLIVFMLVVYVFFPGPEGQRVWPFHVGFFVLPLLLTISFCLTLGFAFLVSAANTFYEDVKYIAGVLLYLLMFICPIMYFSEQVYYSTTNQAHPIFYRLYYMNPVATLCTAYRKAILDPQPVKVNGTLYDAIGMDWKYVIVALIFSVAILVIGYSTFNRLKWKFVERP